MLLGEEQYDQLFMSLTSFFPSKGASQEDLLSSNVCLHLFASMH